MTSKYFGDKFLKILIAFSASYSSTFQIVNLDFFSNTNVNFKSYNQSILNVHPWKITIACVHIVDYDNALMLINGGQGSPLYPQVYKLNFKTGI